MSQPSPFPSNEAPFASAEGKIQQVWYYLLQTLFNRSGGTGAPIPGSGISVGASPFEYEAAVSGTVVVNDTGSTVTEISINRSGDIFVTGATTGPIPVVRGDAVVVTFGAPAPTMSFLPSEATGDQ